MVHLRQANSFDKFQLGLRQMLEDSFVSQPDPRGPKKTSPKRAHDPQRAHVSVARVLTERKAQRQG